MRYFFPLLAFLFFSCQQKPNSLQINLNENWTFEYQQVSYPAIVPGCIHTDLMAHKIIDDPFYRCNEDSVQWVSDSVWVYRTTFDGKEINMYNNAEIVFSGLDTYAEVFLNGEPLLNTEGTNFCYNMFREWRFPLPKNLKRKNNELLIRFTPSEKLNEEKAKLLPYSLPDNRVFTRKAPYQSGWDWGPKLVTCGIWQPVTINAWNDYRIIDFQINQEKLTAEIGEIKVISTFEAEKEIEIIINYQWLMVNEATAIPFTLHALPFTLKPGENKISQIIEIENPKLWWTNGLGEQNLYEITLEVRSKKLEVRSKKLEVRSKKSEVKNQKSKIKNLKSIKWGFRTIELIQEKDEIGESFYFKVNGVPVFMKGANWIPAHAFVSEMTGEKGKAKYKHLLESCKDANMNMIRVWGGGIYENNYFYDLCDELGILVWQDFTFACALYPADSAFVENVRKEAEYQVKRLKNHTSLALWCGNNEVKNGWEDWGWQQNYSPEHREEITKNLHTIFNELLPNVVKKNDNRAYISTSPLWGWGHKESLTHGDSHYWGVWWGEEPFEVWLPKTGRFMSEYGFQSYPQMSTIESFTLPEDRNLESAAMKNHQKHPRGVQIINKAMKQYAHIPAHFEDYIRVSQEVQALGIGKAIEAHRLKRPYCMGTLYWQLNDCWQVASWSSIDFFGHWKLLHHTVKEKFAPVIVAAEELKNGNVNLYVVNDLLKEVSGEIIITHKNNSQIEIPFTAKANASTLIVKNIKNDILKKELRLR